MNYATQQQKPRTLDAWLSYLEKIHPTEIELGLERVESVARDMKLINPAPKVILVGGTNGKGSTVAFLKSILIAAGYRVGCYTSPHLVDYTERVTVQGAQLDAKEHCEAFTEVEAARGSVSLTYFEFGTLAAFWLLKKHQVDVAILEIGLGGRLDAVNLVSPDLSIVTSVAVDHIDFLGDDREQIGYEKAGIYRANTTAICGDLNPPKKLLQEAQDKQANLLQIGHDFTVLKQKESGIITAWELHPQTEKAKNYLPVMLDLPVPKLFLNHAASAIVGLYAAGFNLTETAIRDGLNQASLPGRFEIWDQKPKIILDVAHNPQAAEYLAEQLVLFKRANPTAKRFIALCGMLKDKDISNTLKPLLDLFDIWHVSSLPAPRGIAGAALAQLIVEQKDPKQSAKKKLAIQIFDRVEEAYQAAQSLAQADDVIVCFGSFVTVGEIYQTTGRKLYD